MSKKIVNGRLPSTLARWYPAGRPTRKRTMPVSGVVQHFDGAFSGHAVARYVAGDSIYKGKAVPAARYFGHVEICRDGTVYQHVSFDRVAPHAGTHVPAKPNEFWMGKRAPANVNEFTIGLEHANRGRLNWKAQHRTGITNINGEYWETYSDDAIAASIEVLALIAEAYPQVTRETVQGHSDVVPDRKVDPGPAFPWERILDAVWPEPEDEPAELTDEEFSMLESRYDYEKKMCLK